MVKVKKSKKSKKVQLEDDAPAQEDNHFDFDSKGWKQITGMDASFLQEFQADGGVEIEELDLDDIKTVQFSKTIKINQNFLNKQD